MKIATGNSFEESYLGRDLTFAYGICGENVTWKLEKDTLFLSGKGDMNNSFSPWYGYRNLIKKVVIDEGITSIGRYSFYYCENLEHISLPKSLKLIGEYAFCACASLRILDIPDRLKTIEPNSFKDCNAFEAALKRKRLFAKLRLKRKYS